MVEVHKVKSWPQFFNEIANGMRRHDLRRNDRHYNVGDFVLLQEFDPVTNEYTDRHLMTEITSITSSELPCAVSDAGLAPWFCILSLMVLE